MKIEDLLATDGIVLYEIKESCHKTTINEHSILFVLEGRLQIKTFGNVYTLNRNNYADIIKDDLTVLSASTGIQAYHLILSENFLFTLFHNRPPFPASYILNNKQNPVFQINEKDRQLIVQHLEDIKKTLENRNNFFHQEILQNKVRVFLMEIANIFLQKRQKEQSTETNRKRFIFTQFVKIIPEHIKEEHSVNFYASQLCVSPQYLGRIVQEFSNQTAYHWISKALIREITRLLRETDMTIQEIADLLNFSDQAVLSKMFKRHYGISPLKYRNEQNLQLPAWK